jgi:hypothetical protein
MKVDVPRIQRLDDFPAAQGPEILDDENTLPNGVRLRRSHFWRRVWAGQIECGETAAITFTRKIGITESVLNEVSAGLDIPLGTLKVTLGTKVSISVASTAESTTEIKKSLTSPDCQVIRYAEWQLVDRAILTALKRRWFGLLKPTQIRCVLDNPLDEFEPDRFFYPSPHCCRDDFNKKLKDGYDQLRSVSFPDVTILAMSRVEKDGSLSVAGISGRWLPGQSIPASKFAALFAAIGEPVPREGGRIGLKDCGPARQVLDLSRDFRQLLKEINGCPSIAEMVAQIERNASEGGVDPALDHGNSDQCSRCQAAFAFLRFLTPHARREWAGSDPVVLSLMSPLANDDDAKADALNRRQLSQSRMRVRLLEHHGEVILNLTAWDSALAGKKVEVALLGDRLHETSFPLKSETGGMLTGESNLKVSAEKWSAPGECRIVLIRFVKPSPFLQLIRRAGTIFRRRGQAEVAEENAVPAVAVGETEVLSVGSLMGGIIRSVEGPTLTIEAAVEGGLHVGQNLHVYRDGVFLGVAVVSRTVPGGALGEFQPAGETLPDPGDIAMVPAPE